MTSPVWWYPALALLAAVAGMWGVIALHGWIQRRWQPSTVDACDTLMPPTALGTDSQMLAQDLALADDLAQCLTRGGAGLSLLYQPKMAAQGHFTGAEALLRWQHPVIGRVDPGTFLAVAERHHLMPRLGQWVLHEACRQMAEWHTQGWRVGVAVNLSRQQVADPDLPLRVAQALAQHHVRSELLTLELNDAVHLHAPTVWQQGLAQRLKALAQDGVRLSLDDGQSPVGWLQGLGSGVAHEIKMDGRLLAGEPPDPARLADISLAHAAGLRVVAVGVEDPALAERLRQMGCDELQGYLFAKAMPGRHLAMWLREGLSADARRLSPQSLTALEPHPITRSATQSRSFPTITG
ncbi:EAL domain-containing protein [Aquabacterium lacunae]|uniref:EAL domain-containing protein n=1 Tax=Aquabacterium lacunae TaxID=2528630 RepID=A0A4Q9GW53_9BURK|nr:EAL domain-containing protein [Aquabacterium lacunae]TBO29255.1 EAL domain-containing protein [Aquabacterium lacunae]